jgi:hypothetical protein
MLLQAAGSGKGQKCFDDKFLSLLPPTVAQWQTATIAELREECVKNGLPKSVRTSSLLFVFLPFTSTKPAWHVARNIMTDCLNCRPNNGNEELSYAKAHFLPPPPPAPGRKRHLTSSVW